MGFRWLTDERWGFLPFLADGYIGWGWLWWLGRLLVICWWGGIGGALGCVLGDVMGVSLWIAVPVAILLVFLVLWVVLLGRLLLFFPFPPCRNGKCSDIKAYTWPLGLFYGRWKWGVYVYRCRCGDDYVREGKRFLLVQADGSKQPYMTLTGFRTWTPAAHVEEKEGGNGDKSN